MKEFQGIMEKYTGQYKDNRSKIQRRDTIRAFGQETERVREHAFRYRDVSAQLAGQRARMMVGISSAGCMAWRGRSGKRRR